MSDAGRVALCALGDLILANEWDPLEPARRRSLGELGRLAGEHDVLFSNLETTCSGSEGEIPKQPRILAGRDTVAAAVAALGANVVSLANNHAFDAHRSGRDRVVELLDALGVDHLGSGATAAEAARPLRLEVRGVRLGFLAYADPATRCSHLAGEGPGVNGLDAERAVREVESLAAVCDHVVVSVHWGIEYCSLPSPGQIALGRRLVAAGARLVLGHHAHVIQGVEELETGTVVHGLGNATTTDFRIDGRLAVRQGRATRSGLMVRAHLAPCRVDRIDVVPFRWHGTEVMGRDPVAQQLYERANRSLERGVTEWRWRRRRFYEDLILATARKLRPSVIRSVRPRHVKTFVENLLGVVGRERSLL